MDETHLLFLSKFRTGFTLNSRSIIKEWNKFAYIFYLCQTKETVVSNVIQNEFKICNLLGMQASKHQLKQINNDNRFT